MSNTAYVYWIHRSHHSNTNEGYIGVSKNPKQRFYMHKQGYGNIIVKRNCDLYEDVVLDVILSGDENDCYRYESELRPNKNIGWNFAEGGFKPPSPQGNKERAAKASKSLKGRIVSEETRSKLSASNTGRKKTQAEIDKMLETKRLNGGQIPWNKGKKTGPRGPYKKREKE